MDNAGERRPSSRQVRVERLEVHADIGDLTAIARELPQASPVRHLTLKTDERQHRRHDVHQLRRPPQHARLDYPGRPENKRHPQRGVVGEQAMRPLLVVAERLTVVGGDDDERVGEPALALQLLERGAEPGIGVGNLA